MLKELQEKYHHFRLSFLNRPENWSFYRLTIFFFSYRGQVRLWNFFINVIKFFFRKLMGIKNTKSEHYSDWMQKHFANDDTILKCKLNLSTFLFQPTISIILVIPNVKIQELIFAIECIKKQLYDNWELCICYDKFLSTEIRDEYDKLALADERIILISGNNEKTSALLNHAVDNTTGEFIAFLNEQDTLSPDALYYIVETLNLRKDTDVIYSDEDKIDSEGNHSEPYFKPDWNPDTFLSRNYIGGLICIRKSLLYESAKFREIFQDCHEYDFLLRISEKTDRIFHIQRVLYHRYTENNLKELITDKCSDCVMAIEDALSRRNIEAKVTRPDPLLCLFSIRYKIVHPGKVSIIMPTKNHPELCRVAINSIIKLTDYPEYEIILVDNNSDQEEFFRMVKEYNESLGEKFKYVKDSGDFNFSRIINNGVAHAKGEYLLLLNNDTEIIHPDWMTAMVEQAQFNYNGVIGARLLYPNNIIQHAGVIIGLGGIAHHAFIGMDKDAAGYFNNLKAITNYSAVTAACCMVKKDKFIDVGGFDELLAVEFNDVDFCLKLKEKGCNNIYLPHVTIYHHESISRGHPHKTRESYKRHLADLSVFEKRWRKYIEHDPCYNIHLSRIYTDFRVRV